MKNPSNVVVRIAPSPTGNLHIGTARTALFNYLFAKQNDGKFILRIEDTDKERSKKEYEENIIEGLHWLGMSWDEIYRQSERSDIYKKYIEKLIHEDKAYISKEEAKEEGQRSEVIRFRNPNKELVFSDAVRGEITFNTTDLGDFVIAKTINEPLYHLAVVVDDHDMGVTHVIRGEDHISNTPRQILIQEAIGAKRPVYAHMALILNKDKSKLSKRDGATSVLDYKEKGYIKDAFVNFLALLGWAPKDEKEIFSMDELIQTFRIEDLQKGGAMFNVEKLNWFNKEWIKKIDDKILIEMISSKVNIDNEILKKAIVEIKERIENINNLESLFIEGGEFEYLISLPEFETSKLNWKENTPDATLKHLHKIMNFIVEINLDDFQTKKIKEIIFPYATEEGKGDVLWPLRYSLSGKDRSIDPFTLSYILGKEEVIKRITNAIQKLS